MPGMLKRLTIKAIRFEKTDAAAARKCAKKTKGALFTGIHGEADWETTLEIALGVHKVNTSYIYVIPGAADDGSYMPIADEEDWTDENERWRIERHDGYPSRFDIDEADEAELLDMLQDNGAHVPPQVSDLRKFAKEYFGIDESVA